MAYNIDAVRIINKIHSLLDELTDEDFNRLETMTQKQLDYFNPLKKETTIKNHEIGNHNRKVITCLKKLKEIFDNGKDIWNE